MKSTDFHYKAINLVHRGENKIECDTVYVRNNELSNEIKPHYKRPLYRITCSHSGKSLIRKVRGANWGGLRNGDVVMDYASANDLGVDQNEYTIKIRATKRLSDRIKYLINHPNEDVRLAFGLFIIGVVISLITSVLTGTFL